MLPGVETISQLLARVSADGLLPLGLCVTAIRTYVSVCSVLLLKRHDFRGDYLSGGSRSSRKSIGCLVRPHMLSEAIGLGSARDWAEFAWQECQVDMQTPLIVFAKHYRGRWFIPGYSSQHEYHCAGCDALENSVVVLGV